MSSYGARHSRLRELGVRQPASARQPRVSAVRQAWSCDGVLATPADVGSSPHRASNAGTAPVGDDAMCWMCDCRCAVAGWLDGPRLVVGGGAPLSLLVLCSRCRAALSMPPGTPLLDIVHECHETHYARSRSLPFVAFLREYKILLELIAMEYSAGTDGLDRTTPKGARSTNAERPPAAMVDSISVTVGPMAFADVCDVFQRLMTCITASLDDAAPSAEGTASPQSRRRHPGEWVLKALERQQMLGEHHRLQSILALVVKRHDWEAVDAERRLGGGVTPPARAAAPMRAEMAPEPAFTAALASGVAVHSTPSRALLHNARETSTRRSVPSQENATTSLKGTTEAAAPPVEVDSSRLREHLSQFFLSEKETVLPDDLFFPQLRSTSTSEHQTNRCSDALTTKTPAALVREGAVTPGTTANSMGLQRATAELRHLREEHEAQRRAWVNERQLLLRKLDEQQNAAAAALLAHSHDKKALESARTASTALESNVRSAWFAAFHFACLLQSRCDAAWAVEREKQELLLSACRRPVPQSVPAHSAEHPAASSTLSRATTPAATRASTPPVVTLL